jgi:hypothetical protein
MAEKTKPKRRGLKIFILCLVVVIIIAAGIWLYKFLPTGMPDGEDYFKSIGERKLLEDEKGQWQYVRHLYGSMEASGDTFAGWDNHAQPFWKYAIAFTAYGMPSLALIDPENADMTKYMMWVMVKKMKSKKVWRDWVDMGFGEDPISYQNIMYKGHLNLMYGLYQLMSGDERFAKEYTWLTRQIVDEMRQHHEEGLYDGTNCEPDQYFVQCNSIGLLSLHIYDKLYGTNYTENEVRWALDFIHRRMVDPETGLYWMEYHPSHDNVERFLSGYTNAWAMVVLRPLDPEYNEKIYQSWKDVFVEEFGPYAYVKEFPDGGASPMATAFGIWAAKEFGDVELFTKLRNSTDKMGELTWVPKDAEMIYKKADNTLNNGTIFSFKIHAGWDEILNRDWGYETPMEIPDVSGMTWKDVLPQEIYEMEYPTEGPPL